MAWFVALLATFWIPDQVWYDGVFSSLRPQIGVWGDGPAIQVEGCGIMAWVVALLAVFWIPDQVWYDGGIAVWYDGGFGVWHDGGFGVCYDVECQSLNNPRDND